MDDNMEAIERTVDHIKDDISEMNKNPTFQAYANFIADLDFYSDIYKDEYGYRPRIQCRAFYDELTQRAKVVANKYAALPYEEQEKYSPYNK